MAMPPRILKKDPNSRYSMRMQSKTKQRQSTGRNKKETEKAQDQNACHSPRRSRRSTGPMPCSPQPPFHSIPFRQSRDRVINLNHKVARETFHEGSPQDHFVNPFWDIVVHVEGSGSVHLEAIGELGHSRLRICVESLLVNNIWDGMIWRFLVLHAFQCRCVVLECSGMSPMQRWRVRPGAALLG